VTRMAHGSQSHRGDRAEFHSVGRCTLPERVSERRRRNVPQKGETKIPIQVMNRSIHELPGEDGGDQDLTLPLSSGDRRSAFLSNRRRTTFGMFGWGRSREATRSLIAICGNRSLIWVCPRPLACHRFVLCD